MDKGHRNAQTPSPHIRWNNFLLEKNPTAESGNEPSNRLSVGNNVFAKSNNRTILQKMTTKSLITSKTQQRRRTPCYVNCRFRTAHPGWIKMWTCSDVNVLDSTRLHYRCKSTSGLVFLYTRLVNTSGAILLVVHLVSQLTARIRFNN